MDGLTLLQEALAAGLMVLADGDRLVIRGPRSADAVARRLLAHKAVILAALAADDGSPCPWDEAMEPGDPCPVCGSLEKWWDILGGEHCQQCEHATLDKAVQLANQAARLRQRAQRQKPILRVD